MPRREVVGAVENDVRLRRRAARAPPAPTRRATRSTRTSGLTAAMRSPAASTFGRPTSAVANRIWRCRLVRSTLVGVDQGQRPDAGRGEKLRCRVAQAADADDQRMRVRKALLRVDAQLGQQHVPAVAQQLGVVHRRFPLPRSFASKNARASRASCVAEHLVAYCGATAATALVDAMTGKTLQAVQRLLELKVIGRAEFQTRLRRVSGLLRVFLRLLRPAS